MSAGLASPSEPRPLVIGIGNELRGDDGCGLRVIDALQRDPTVDADLVRTTGEPAALLDLWRGRDRVVIIDALVATQVAGTILRWVPRDGRWRPEGAATSSHGLSLGEAIELGRSLGRLPRRLVVLGIVAADLTIGAGLTSRVAEAIPRIAAEVRREIAATERDAEGADGRA